MQMLTTKFKNLRMQSLKTIGQFYAKLCDLSNQSFAFVEEYINSKLTSEMNLDEAKRSKTKGGRSIDLQVIAQCPLLTPLQ
ncbi:hypothetical protein J1N35_025344 [Gossypium stocksii]|uniref:Uncharacterized protein n=1 Tax=Gossypium stocksii TaxID=47602 RepID=A0A9D3V6F5_9ROSI|nr:hypothetical protein J1N35_025344 [Gossypium stocksii]